MHVADRVDGKVGEQRSREAMSAQTCREGAVRRS